MATVGILLVGLVAIVWLTSPAERRRRGIVRELEVGDSISRVTGMLGSPPARCPGGDLAHLAGSFPPGWPAASRSTALQTMQEHTRERWVYPVNRRRVAGCTPRRGQTEIGVDPAGRVLWYVAVTGKTPLRLPGDFTPATPSGSPQ